MVTLDKDRYLEWAQEYAHTNTLFDAKRGLELLNITFFGGEWHALLRQQSAYAGLSTKALVPLWLVRTDDHRPLWLVNKEEVGGEH